VLAQNISTPQVAAARVSQTPRMIDVHTHLHPPKLFAAIRRWFAERSDWDLSLHPTEPAAVAAILRAQGVERFVFFSYAHKPGMARDLNGWLAATSRELEGYGLPLGTIHPGDPAYLEDLRVALDLGCIGIKLHEDVQALAVDDVRFDAVYEELSARGAFLLVHVGPIPWAYPPDAGAARVQRVLERHPELRVVVAHFGTPDTQRYFDLMDRHPHLYLDTTMVFAEGSPVGSASPLDVARMESHAARILYGTDFPNIPHPYPSERLGIERLGLSAGARAAIFHENARQLIARASAG
jgi:predicted TIM-barrel fold metal-dependent hydrolase